MTAVFDPDMFLMSFDLPTARIRPRQIAKASTSGWVAFTVQILPLIRIVSAATGGSSAAKQKTPAGTKQKNIPMKCFMEKRESKLGFVCLGLTGKLSGRRRKIRVGDKNEPAVTHANLVPCV
jgi:hypothetical protein